MTLIPRSYIEQYEKTFPEMDVDMVHFFANTMMTFHHFTILMESYFHTLGLSKGRFMVLIQLFVSPEPEGMSITEISGMYKVSSATMTGIIDVLEREGHIERIQSRKDRRKINIRLTGTGREFMKRILPLHQENIRRILGGIGEDEREQFSRLLGKLYLGLLDFINDGEPQ